VECQFAILPGVRVESGRAAASCGVSCGCASAQLPHYAQIVFKPEWLTAR